MAAKAILAVCAVLVQSALGQCGVGLGAGCNGLAGAGCNGLAGAGLAGLGGYGFGGVASTGGGLPVTSFSPIAPIGVSVVSENAIKGSLSAGGNLPFLSTVAVEGALPTAGEGAVSYGCGDGAVGIVAENGPIATGIGAGPFPPMGPAGFAGYGPGLAGLGFNGLGYNGLAGYGYGPAGCGCGASY